MVHILSSYIRAGLTWPSPETMWYTIYHLISEQDSPGHPQKPISYTFYHLISEKDSPGHPQKLCGAPFIILYRNRTHLASPRNHVVHISLSYIRTGLTWPSPETMWYTFYYLISEQDSPGHPQKPCGTPFIILYQNRTHLAIPRNHVVHLLLSYIRTGLTWPSPETMWYTFYYLRTGLTLPSPETMRYTFIILYQSRTHLAIPRNHVVHLLLSYIRTGLTWPAPETMLYTFYYLISEQDSPGQPQNSCGTPFIILEQDSPGHPQKPCGTHFIILYQSRTHLAIPRNHVVHNLSSYIRTRLTWPSPETNIVHLLSSYIRKGFTWPSPETMWCTFYHLISEQDSPGQPQKPCGTHFIILYQNMTHLAIPRNHVVHILLSYIRTGLTWPSPETMWYTFYYLISEQDSPGHPQKPCGTHFIILYQSRTHLAIPRNHVVHLLLSYIRTGLTWPSPETMWYTFYYLISEQDSPGHPQKPCCTPCIILYQNMTHLAIPRNHVVHLALSYIRTGLTWPSPETMLYTLHYLISEQDSPGHPQKPCGTHFIILEQDSPGHPQKSCGTHFIILYQSRTHLAIPRNHVVHLLLSYIRTGLTWPAPEFMWYTFYHLRTGLTWPSPETMWYTFYHLISERDSPGQPQNHVVHILSSYIRTGLTWPAPETMWYTFYHLISERDSPGQPQKPCGTHFIILYQNRTHLAIPRNHVVHILSSYIRTGLTWPAPETMWYTFYHLISERDSPGQPQKPCGTHFIILYQNRTHLAIPRNHVVHLLSSYIRAGLTWPAPETMWYTFYHLISEQDSPGHPQKLCGTPFIILEQDSPGQPQKPCGTHFIILYQNGTHLASPRNHVVHILLSYIRTGLTWPSPETMWYTFYYLQVNLDPTFLQFFIIC